MGVLSLFRAAAILIAIATAATAAEPRPWLCRDKPSFSSDSPIAYDASARGPHRWQLFLMQFQANAAHDGFGIVRSHDLSARSHQAAGAVGSGRYFAVAMYLASNGHWICSQSSDNSDSSSPAGVLANLCYSADDSDDCGVTLTVHRAPPR